MVDLIDKFDERLRRLDSHDRGRFLHGVYKQVVESHKGRKAKGEYGAELSQIPDYQRNTFLFHLVETLVQWGLETHALRLLSQYEFDRPHKQLKQTLYMLETVDPSWMNKAKMWIDGTGIQMDYGGFAQNNSFSASIIVTPTDYKGKTYEILPIFDGKRLTELDLDKNTEVHGGLPLERAVSLANAALSRNPERFRTTHDNLYQPH